MRKSGLPIEDSRSRTLTVVGLGSVGVAYPLQTALMIPALPVLGRELHTTKAWTTWIITVAFLVSAVAAPLAGKLGDQFGKKRVLVCSTGIVFAATLGAVFAWNIWSLIVFRAFGGIGGGCVALSIAIVRDEFPRATRSQAIGLVSGIFGLGGATGMLLSGLVLDHLSWRWLFVIGALGIGLATLLVIRLVPESIERAPARLDVPGAVLFSAGVLCLLLALTEVQRWGVTSPQILGLLLGSLALVLAWVRVEARAPAPMVDLRLLTNRTVVLTYMITLLSALGLLAIFVLIPNLIQAPRGLSSAIVPLVHYGFGASSTQVSLYLAPAALVQFFAGALAGVLGARLGSKLPLALGLGLEACGAAALALWHSSPAEVIAFMVVLGTGFGLAAGSAPRLVADAVQPSQTGVANGLTSLGVSLGGVIGGQLAALLMSAETIPGTSVPAESAFGLAFWSAALLALTGAALALFLTRRPGPSVRTVPVVVGDGRSAPP